MSDRIWRVVTIISFTVLLCICLSRLDSPTHSRPIFTTPLHAGGVTVAKDDAEVVFTASQDGKTVYMWQYFSSKPPKFLGKAEAVLSQ